MTIDCFCFVGYRFSSSEFWCCSFISAHAFYLLVASFLEDVNISMICARSSSVISGFQTSRSNTTLSLCRRFHALCSYESSKSRAFPCSHSLISLATDKPQLICFSSLLFSGTTRGRWHLTLRLHGA